MEGFDFGLIMGLVARYSHRKQIKKETNETESRPCDSSL